MAVRAALTALGALVLLYLWLLHQQLRKAHPDARCRSLPSVEELHRISEYSHLIEGPAELEGIAPLEGPEYGVCVVGASGLLGRALVRLLRRRGHRASDAAMTR